MKNVVVNVPGKIMLGGEYAVLRQGAAMACTISSAMEVTASASASGCYEVSSDIWDKKIVLDTLHHGSAQWNEPAVQVLRHLQKHHPQKNLHLSIKSKLKIQDGVGSSSALRFGCLLAAEQYFSPTPLQKTDRWDVARTAFLLQKTAQRDASGYDIATQCVGGLTVMRPHDTDDSWPGLVAHISDAAAKLNQFVLPLTGGSGAPTTALVQATRLWLDQHRQWDHLIDVSERLVEAFTQVLSKSEVLKNDVSALIEAVVSHRNFFSDSPAGQNELIPHLKNMPGFDQTWTCKTTGAGGNDALLLIGMRDLLEPLLPAISNLGWQPSNFHFIEQMAACVEDQE